MSEKAQALQGNSVLERVRFAAPIAALGATAVIAFGAKVRPSAASELPLSPSVEAVQGVTSPDWTALAEPIANEAHHETRTQQGLLRYCIGNFSYRSTFLNTLNDRLLKGVCIPKYIRGEKGKINEEPDYFKSKDPKKALTLIWQYPGSPLPKPEALRAERQYWRAVRHNEVVSNHTGRHNKPTVLNK